MSVAIVVDSKHGSTYEIAEHLSAALGASGIDASVFKPAEISSLRNHSAAIIGSGVYAGQWLPDARHFIEHHSDELRTMPVWLFSSGPIGELTPDRAIRDETVQKLVQLVDAREHRIFSGKLDRATLSRSERLITRVVRAPEGDFRDFDDIALWAGEIAASLTGNQRSSEVMV